MGLFGKKEKVIKVLSIDDSRLVQELLSFVIRDMGFEFLTADNGKDGVKLAEKEQPDAILLDILMPGISGLDTCLLLKKNRKTSHIPVIMCTSESLMRTVETALQNGAAGYLNKPFNIEQVKFKLAKVLNMNISAKAPVNEAAPLPQAQSGISQSTETQMTASAQTEQPPPGAHETGPGAASPPPPSVPPQERPATPVLPYFCGACYKYLVYVPQYKLYYCYACNSYPSPQPTPPSASKQCTTCGGELAFLHDRDQWYCFICKK